MNSTSTIKEIRTLLDRYMASQGFDLAPTELYAPMNYILGIGGKRFRPIALIAACRVFSEDIDQALPAAYAIELFHNFSLIHDDIMDAAPLRRGEPTVHHKWNLNTGILSADAMLIYSFKYLNEGTNPDNCQKIHQVFTDISIKVCEGQQMDVNFETASSIAIEDYIEMIYKKTGALVEGAMQIGALMGGADIEQSEMMGRVAKKMGISFQLQDDILDAYGTKAKVGKQIGGDIIQNKKTILYLLTAQDATDADQKALNHLFEEEQDSRTKIDQTMALYDKYDVKTKAEAIRDQYHHEALEIFGNLQADEGSKGIITDLFNQLLYRVS